jgi:penicillin-binding protein
MEMCYNRKDFRRLIKLSKQEKNRIDLIEEKLETMNKTKWAKRMRITSGVTWNLFLLFLVVSLTLVVFAGSVGAGYFASLVAKEPLRSKQEMRDAVFNYEETSEFYSSGPVYVGGINSDIIRKETKLDKISPYVIDAVFATEDEYFKEHNGIVPKAIFRGLIQDVTNSDSQTGGSTLTQQLIKNQVLTNEISYERKAKEILLAMRIEHFMDKDEILEAYLNIIPYGRNANGQNIAGVETAAEGIFGKKALDLNLPQAAFIAGLPQAPFAYTPFKSFSEGGKTKETKFLKPGIDRMKTVLFRMKETEYITEQQYNEAITYDITKDFRKPTELANVKYPFLTQEIQNRTIKILAKIIAEKDGIDSERLNTDSKVKEKYTILAERSMRNDGLRIYSTVDIKLYNAMNDEAKKYEGYGYTYADQVIDKQTGETKTVKYPVQVGAIMIENSTGKILSFVGGRDHELEGVNHATQAPRQNGSTMKPLLVYGPAIEYGEIGAGSPVVDVKFEIAKWKPVNFLRNQELGVIPARQALASSQNLATARLYNDIINRRPADFLKLMGFSKLKETDYENLSLSLGTLETTVEENTNAFATFANGGKFIETYMIEKIEDKEGNIVYQHETTPVEVFSPQTSYIVTDMLRDVIKSGTGTNMKKNLNFSIDMAAKTGTTDAYSDAWFVGYNPNISMGVWIGYKYPTLSLQGPGNDKYGTSNTRTTSIFARLLNKANETSPELIGASARFQRPEGVVNRSFCGISGLAPSAACSAAGLVKSDLFNSKVMVPTKLDDSITSSSYVSVKGVKYAALPSTPGEFVSSGGIGVNQVFINRMLGPWGGNAAKLFPANSAFASHVVSGAIFNADNVAPAQVNVTLNGSTLTWHDSPSNDVIGYYVYQNGTKVGTIKDMSSNAFTVGPGSYSVRAVDITGKLSNPSNAVAIEESESVEVKPETPPVENKPPETPSVENEPPVTIPPVKDDGKDDENGGSTTPPATEDDGTED